MKATSGSGRLSLLAGLALTIGASAFVFAQQNGTSGSTNGGGTWSGRAGGQVSGGGSASAGGSASSSSSSSGSSSKGGNSGGGGMSFGANKPLYAAWYSKAPDSRNDGNDSNVDREHTQYMKQLTQDQTLVIEGPFGDGSGYMAVIQSDSPETALRIINNDPSVKNGSLKVVVKPWQMRHGGTLPQNFRMPVPSNVGRGGSVSAGGG